MGKEVHLLDSLPKTKRDIKQRLIKKTDEDCLLAKQFGQDYFDGERQHGYGGYRYDGRWLPVARRISEYYQLSKASHILDIGCAKGFLMYDFLQILPDCKVRGLDVSRYAKENAHNNMGSLIDIGSAETLPYADNSFDLVIAINSLHNLPNDLCRQALQEIERVSRHHSFTVVDAWKTDRQKQSVMDWVLTAKTVLHVDDWRKMFAETGYTGDYDWCIIE